mmetsp:Transcript_11691/g.50001  ORF Transcript_11691/g.50001 Transcript_11691/m.50001 type:complete len:373 (+) Transcript_11691:1680-2798(+)
MPALWIAAAISRSPLLPSSRRIATRTLSVFDMTASEVRSGAYVRCHAGASRCRRDASSAATVASELCRRSSANDVASHVSRRSATAASTTTTSPARTTARPSLVDDPTSETVTPAAAYVASTSWRFSWDTSRKRASSSAKSADCQSPSSLTGRVTSIPAVGCGNAISKTEVTNPPSDTSCPAAILRSATKVCVASQAFLKYETSSISGATSPIWPYACAKAEPPRRLLPSLEPNSTSRMCDAPGVFKSGVTVLVTSGTVTYPDITTEPGALTTSPSARAAMDSESLPPSMATSNLPIASHSALHASNMCAPSPGSFAAYIQLPEYFTSFKPVVFANTKLVSDSPSDMRAIAAGSTIPLIGCSPMHVAPPVMP